MHMHVRSREHRYPPFAAARRLEDDVAVAAAGTER